MKLRHRKVLALFSVLAIVAAACGDDDETAADGTDTAPDGADAGEFEFDGTIKVGLSQELTGSQAAFGRANTAGYEVAFTEINEKGGVVVDGERYEFEILSEDSRSDPTTAFNLAQQFADEGVVAVAASDFGFAEVYEFLQDEGIITLGSGGLTFQLLGAPNGPEENPMLFSNPPLSATLAGSWYGQLTALDPDIGSQAVLIEGPPDPSGQLFGDQIMPGAAQGNGVEHLATELFPPGTSDFSSFLTNLASDEPDIVFTGLFPPDNIAAATQAAQLDVAPRVWTFSIRPDDFSDLSVFEGKTLYLSQSGTVFGGDFTIPAFEEAEERFLDVLGELPPAVTPMIGAYHLGLSLAAGVDAAQSLEPADIAEAMVGVEIPACDESDVAWCSLFGPASMTETHATDRGTALIEVVDGSEITYHLYRSFTEFEPIESVPIDLG